MLRGTLNLRGARTAPDIDIDLAGDGIAFGDYRAERLLAKGRLPWNRGNGALDIDASGLQLGLPVSSLQASLRGAVERLQFEATAQSDIGKLELRGDANKQGARWQGALAALQFDPELGAAWTLQQPARWSWDGRNGALSRACLRSGGGGDLCASADWPRRGLELQGDEPAAGPARAVSAGARGRTPVGAEWRHRPGRAGQTRRQCMARQRAADLGSRRRAQHRAFAARPGRLPRPGAGRDLRSAKDQRHPRRGLQR